MSMSTDLQTVASATESVAYVGVRGYGSGGWFAGCKFNEQTIEVDASSPDRAAKALRNAVQDAITAQARATEREHVRHLAALEALTGDPS